ncbi:MULTISPECIES: DNA repair and recombination protein RadB [Methanobrevibacter]|uniref:DNA repair and recombination protein RadB n=1 Tax=Methanobrevibacter TaxID=2172 RepID=UPI0015BF26DF|nr:MULTISPECIES: DNA repair and recombination protein RadB [Methanobrevibacter]MBS7258074.1 DNA repair and recombination protein RadB [Methanobrevibacter sp.]MCI7427835.1 DNA repair and recombination protein RadB [Methanobrevibacter sp.]MDD6776617.1 DNA repair and recombination protein RadB [Methanobacteriaceae archaeon]MDY3096445.1 DNA repair and recombination protein RadB [Methanobrevibacter sp.]
MKVLANFEDTHKILSNSALDVMLGGGFEKGTITQIFGAPSSGKSNVALSLAVNVAKSDKKVIYIDTEGGISIDRIKQISGEDFSKVANNIIVFEPTNFLEQNDTIKSIDVWLRKNHDDVDLIIVDSAVALYRVDDMKSSRLNKELGKQMGILSKIARQYDVAVILTNQIYSSYDDEGNNDIKAVGGTILQYWSKAIIQLERGDDINQRIATLKRHRSIPEGKQAIFSITSRGII